ncbi:uncharacterized protein LOC131622848 [Vicia villosa]|uniref:uncharacterized protein LOC131622848 n=1 Tax=Vicia villosa TaxID=3911 RepID=UPI00273BC20C|nr:uncharacterized protein LOC131622848 [Vicia villosa]
MNAQRRTEVMDAGRIEGLNSIWRAYVPSKLKIFGWRMIRDKLPTQKQLLKRHIIQQLNESLCVFCQVQVEYINYVLLQCVKLEWLWRKVFVWLDIQRPNDEVCWEHLFSSEEALKGRIGKKRGVAIWLTTCWCIWKHRNDIMFNGAVLDMEQVYHSILRYSWWWLAIASKNRINCNLYEWIQNPSLCI